MRLEGHTTLEKSRRRRRIRRTREVQQGRQFSSQNAAPASFERDACCIIVGSASHFICSHLLQVTISLSRLVPEKKLRVSCEPLRAHFSDHFGSGDRTTFVASSKTGKALKVHFGA